MMNYYTNTAAYAKNCINKARPKLHCNGKCQMMKKMQQEEKKDQQNPERKAENKAEVLSSKSYFHTNIPAFVMSFCKPSFINNEGTEIKMPRSIFHPPGV